MDTDFSKEEQRVWESRTAGRILPLSVVFERLQVEGEIRDRAFVRRASAWLHERAVFLELRVVEVLGLTDVVATFNMRDAVSLVVTGYPPGGLPGAITMSIKEQEFPHVLVRIRDVRRSDPYEVCTMDYSHAGRRVWFRSEKGQQSGTVLVVSTIGSKQSSRVLLDDGRTITAAPEELSRIGKGEA